MESKWGRILDGNWHEEQETRSVDRLVEDARELGEVSIEILSSGIRMNSIQRLDLIEAHKHRVTELLEVDLAKVGEESAAIIEQNIDSSIFAIKAWSQSRRTIELARKSLLEFNQEE